MSGDNQIIKKRQQIVETAQQLGITKAAELFKLNRKTVSCWLARYREKGISGLQSNYQKKTVHPQSMSESETDQIISLKTENPNYSAAKIKHLLQLSYSLTAINRKLRKIINLKKETQRENSFEVKEFRLICGKNRLFAEYDYRYILYDLQNNCNYYCFTDEYSRNSVLDFLNSFYQCQKFSGQIKILHCLPFLKETALSGLILQKSKFTVKNSCKLLENESFIRDYKNLDVFKFNAYQIWFNFHHTASFDEFQSCLSNGNYSIDKNKKLSEEFNDIAAIFSTNNQLEFAESAYLCGIYWAQAYDLISDKSEFLLKLTRFYQKKSDLDKAISTIKTALIFSKKNKLTLSLIKAYGLYGILLQSSGNNRAALIYLNKQFKLSCDEDLPVEQTQAALSLGVLYNNLGNYSKSLLFYEKVIQLSKKSGQKAHKLTALGNIGVIFWRKNKISMALEYFKAALNMAIESCNKRQTARMYGNIGAVLDELHHQNEAKIYYEKQLNLALEIRNESLQSAALANLGGIYKSAGKYKEALELFNQALLITEKRSDKEKTAIILGEIAVIYFKSGSAKPALLKINRAIKLAQFTGDNFYLSSFYLQKAEMFYVESKIRQAAMYLKLADTAFKQADRQDLITEYKILEIKIDFDNNSELLLSSLEELWLKTRSAESKKEIAEEIVAFASKYNGLILPAKYIDYIKQYYKKLEMKSKHNKV